MKKILILTLVILFCFTLFWWDRNNTGGAKLISLEKIIKELSATQKIVIRDADVVNENIIKIITDNKEIEEIINIISRSNEVHGPVPSDMHTWIFVMYDMEDNIISTMLLVWRSGRMHFGNSMDYSITDINALIEIIEN